MLLFGAASVINAVFVRLALKMIFLACKAYQEKFKCAIIPVAFESHSLATLQWGYPGRRMCVLEVKSSGVPQNPVLVPLIHSCCLLRQPAVCEKGMNGCRTL